MSISVNGQSCVPPGFRFHPTEEELLNYYLRKKVASQQIDLDVIRDVDLNKLEPWDIQERCKIGSGPQNDWYFFSHKDKKYPTGTRTNRATAAGFWKATGRDKAIYNAVARIGMRKTLVFYKGRAPHGLKSDWIMHEYRLLDADDSASAAVVTASSASDAAAGQQQGEDGWVVCRVFKKKHHHKDSTSSGSGKKAAAAAPPSAAAPAPETTMDWAMMDRLVASHLNGQLHDESSAVDDDRRLCSSSAFDAGAGAGDDDGGLAFYSAAAATRLLGAVDDDLWSFARSAERLGHGHASQ